MKLLQNSKSFGLSEFFAGKGSCFAFFGSKSDAKLGDTARVIGFNEGITTISLLSGSGLDLKIRLF